MKTLMALITLFLAVPSWAAVTRHVVEYKSKAGARLEGVAYYDDLKSASQPAVIIVHDWMGLGEFAEAKAKELAHMGYVAFAADIYGKGVRPKDAKGAGEQAGKYKNDRALLRSRIRAAYDQVKAMPFVKPVNSPAKTDKEIVVMGYCFGGTTALELARSGAQLAGVASFHGGLSTPTPADAKNIKEPVLVMHGADDPHVPPSEVEAFKKEMKEAKVDLKFVSYPGAVHAFAVPGANDKEHGAAYDADADKKSWKEFTGFLAKVTK